jgi:hypothetical protein
MVDVIVKGISSAFHATVIADHRSKIGAPGYGRLAARHTCVAQYDGGKRVPATMSAIADADAGQKRSCGKSMRDGLWNDGELSNLMRTKTMALVLDRLPNA